MHIHVLHPFLVGEVTLRCRGPWFIVVWFILMAHQASGAYEHFCDADTSISYGDCGRPLANMLQRVCNQYGGFNGLIRKRSQVDDEELRRLHNEMQSKIHTRKYSKSFAP